MSDQKEEKMVSVAISDSNREALKLLRKKYKVSRMDEVISLLLSSHEKDALNKGVKLASIRRSMQDDITEEE